MLSISSILRKSSKLITQPKVYFPKLFAHAQKILTHLFKDLPFFAQGQMDLHPRSLWHNPDFVEYSGGFFPLGDKSGRRIESLEPWDNTRRDMLVLLLRTVIEKKIEGDFAEIGVYKGNTARLMHAYAPERNLHLFDTFEGFTEKSESVERENTGQVIEGSHFSDSSLELVKDSFPDLNNVNFYKGFFPDSIPDELQNQKFAFVHLDADLYGPTFSGLEFFYPRMSRNGIIVIHDFNTWHGARKAVEDFFASKQELPVPMPDKSGSAVIVKQ